MTTARAWLIVGIIASILVAIAVYFRLGIVAGISSGVILVAIVGVTVQYLFRYYIPSRKFAEFLSGNLFFDCRRNGKCCTLWVELDKADYDRIIAHAKKNAITTEVIFKRGDKHWLAHRKGGACVFLETTREGNTCTAYEVRPTACRLYPVVPEGDTLRLDVGCSSCLNRTKGKTFQEYLQSQGVMGYVRRHWKEADAHLPKR